MRACLALVLAVLLVSTKDTSPGQNQTALDSSAVASIERKFQRIASNGQLPQPDQTPTELTEQEISAYFSSGDVKLPTGVQSVRFEGQPGIVTGTSRVDFDQLKAGHNSYNPLLAVFTGVHDVVTIAHARGVDGRAFVHIDSVSLDGVEIPQFALQLFVDKYLTPKYPGIGLDSQFALPHKIDTATIGSHKLTITQK